MGIPIIRRSSSMMQSYKDEYVIIVNPLRLGCGSKCLGHLRVFVVYSFANEERGLDRDELIVSISANEFIFIKTRKTAGTSIEIALSNFCKPEDIITCSLSKSEENDERESNHLK